MSDIITPHHAINRFSEVKLSEWMEAAEKKKKEEVEKRKSMVSKFLYVMLAGFLGYA